MDPAELDLRGAGLMRASEAETGRQFWTHGRRHHLDQEAIVTAMRESGIDHLLIPTDRPYVKSVRHFFATRGLIGCKER